MDRSNGLRTIQSKLPSARDLTMATRPRHFRVAHCHGLPALLSLAMYQRLTPMQGVSLWYIARLRSAGTPEPGNVPKTNPLHGRWITVTGGQSAFIKESIKAGMLGAAEANKIQADTDHEKTGGMYLRINQFGDTCTVDASVAKYARAKRTWRSGHYFYEPLVSGGNLLGVWVLPEEYRKIGFFWEMDSGRCFRIERRAFERNGYMYLRQATEVNGKLSFVFYIKVNQDPESQPIPVQSRDYTALAGHDNVPDNLGKPYPCTAKDLDYPTKRDTWLDKNEAEMQKQKTLVASAFANVCDNGFEVHDNPVGGALSAAHVEALGKEHFER